MQDGETKNVFVTTADHAYFVTATGYLEGDIETVIPIVGNEQLIEDAWREFDNGSDRSAEAYSAWREAYGSRPGRRSRNTAGTERSGAAGGPAGLDGRESGDSDTVGSSWENYGYSSWEELIAAVDAGALIMDDDGNIIAKQYQKRSNTLTNREVLALAVVQTGSRRIYTISRHTSSPEAWRLFLFVAGPVHPRSKSPLRSRHSGRGYISRNIKMPPSFP